MCFLWHISVQYINYFILSHASLNKDPFNKRVYFEIDVFKLLPIYKTQTTFSLELTIVYVNEHNVHLNETLDLFVMIKSAQDISFKSSRQWWETNHFWQQLINIKQT